MFVCPHLPYKIHSIAVPESSLVTWRLAYLCFGSVRRRFRLGGRTGPDGEKRDKPGTREFCGNSAETLARETTVRPRRTLCDDENNIWKSAFLLLPVIDSGRRRGGGSVFVLSSTTSLLRPTALPRPRYRYVLCIYSCNGNIMIMDLRRRRCLWWAPKSFSGDTRETRDWGRLESWRRHCDDD